MTPQELDQKAHDLYDACGTIKPAWSQLGPVTKSVWADQVLAGVTPEDYTACRKPASPRPLSP